LFLSEIVGAVKGKNLTPVPRCRGEQMAICVFAQCFSVAGTATEKNDTSGQQKSSLSSSVPCLAVAGTATEEKRHFRPTKIKSQQQRSWQNEQNE
jgi:hypothetical protein